MGEVLPVAADQLGTPRRVISTYRSLTARIRRVRDSVIDMPSGDSAKIAFAHGADVQPRSTPPNPLPPRPVGRHRVGSSVPRNSPINDAVRNAYIGQRTLDQLIDHMVTVVCAGATLRPLDGTRRDDR